MTIEYGRSLVTGAGGFIGSHLTEALAEQGVKVTALVHYNAMRDIGNLAHLSPRLLDQIDIVFGDLCDTEFCRGLTEGHDTVFHLAALIAIPYSYVAPRSYVRVNIEGTLNVLEACRQAKVRRLVHTSTSEVYGSARYVPIDEAHPLQGQSPYSASKIGADMLAHSYFSAFDLPVTTVRPFNTYGPRQSARAFIPTVIKQALAGDEVRLGALSPVRDMTFASDTVAGFLAAAQGPDLVGKTVNLGVSEGVSIGEIAQMILEIMNSSARITVDPSRVRPRRSEVDRLISDNRAFKAMSTWAPQVPLREGLERTIAFFRQQTPSFEDTRYVV